MVVVFCFNCYHNLCIVRRSQCYVLVESRSQTLVGEISAFSFQGYNEV